MTINNRVFRVVVLTVLGTAILLGFVVVVIEAALLGVGALVLVVAVIVVAIAAWAWRQLVLDTRARPAHADD